MDEARAVWWRLVLRPILPLMVAVPVTEFLARTMRGLGPLWAIQQDSFVQVAIASIAVVFCMSLTNRRLALLAVGGGVLAFDVLNGVLSAMPLAQKTANALLLLPFGAIGVAGFVAAIGRAHGAARAYWARRFAIALVVPMMCLVAPFGLWLSLQQTTVYDLHILAFEDTLGLRLSSVSMTVAAALPALRSICAFAYFTIALGFVLLRLVQGERGEEGAPGAPGRRVDVLGAFVAAGAVGYALYFLVPAVGPTITLAGPLGGTWPAPGTVAAEIFIGEEGAARNAMPSLHTAWSLLLVFNSGALARWPRRGFRAFAGLNIAATMLLGEHWIADLVVAVPFAVAIQALCTPADARTAPARRGAIALGVALVAAWLAALRWLVPGAGAIPGALSWLALAATVVLPLLLERRLRLRGARWSAAMAGKRSSIVPVAAG